VRLGVDVSSEETVAHVAGVAGVIVVVVVSSGVRSQVLHGVGGADEAGVGAQVQVEALAKRVQPVVRSETRHSSISTTITTISTTITIIQAPAPPPVVQLLGERLSEVIDPERGDDLIGRQLLDETF